MEEQAKVKEGRKWDKYAIIALVIMLAAIGIRLYYYSITIDQPEFWDAAEYLATAKSYAGIMPYELSGQRMQGFPMVMSLFFLSGMDNEGVMRFIALFIPSIVFIWLIYLLIKEMYPDRRVALISLAIMAVLWEHLFWSNRFHTENFALIFQMLSFLFVYKFMKKNNWITLALSAAFALIAVFFRPGNMIFIPALALFLLIVYRKQVFSKKGMTWLAGFGIMALTAWILLPSAFRDKLIYLVGSYVHTSDPISWNSLLVFSGLYGSLPGIPPLLLYAFFIGCIACVADLFIKRKSQDANDQKEWKSDLLNVILMLAVMCSFMFVVRAPYFELRWFFPFLPALLAFTAKGAISFADSIGNALKSKAISVFIIIAIVLTGCVTQVAYADSIIKLKSTAYMDVKNAGLWLKDNTAKNDIVFSISKPQTAYYSERKVESYSLLNNSAQFDDFITGYLANGEWKDAWVMVSIYEPHPPWIWEWLDKNTPILQPYVVYYSDKTFQYKTLGVYKIIH